MLLIFIKRKDYRFKPIYSNFQSILSILPILMYQPDETKLQ